MTDIRLLEPRRSQNRKQQTQDSLPDHSESRRPQAMDIASARIDRILIYITMAIAGLGMIAIYSASAMEAMDKFGTPLYFVIRQFIFVVAGLGLMLGVSRIPFFAWSRFTKILAFAVIGLLLYTMLNGVEAYGAERWIRIFGIQFQPSELGKLSAVLLLAQALSYKMENRNRLGFLFNLALLGVTLFLTYQQPSLSMTVIIAFVSAAMMFIAGISPVILLTVGTLGGAGIIYKLMHTEYQMRRIQGWLDPWKDPQDTGYNLIHSLYAIGSGGLIGTGLGESHQKLYYLPFHYTDFIFSIWAEEWGFLGCLVLIGLFMALLYRGFTIAKTCRSSFGQQLAMGITLILGVQIIINLCVATGLFPVTGVTLPLFSYGGTSVLVTMIMLGILLNISRYRTTVSSISPAQES